MKKILKTHKGFTLVEFMVAVGISAVVVIPMIMLLSSNAQKSKTQVEKSSIGITDIIHAQNMIVQDLSEAEPSFNFLNLEAENGNAEEGPADCQNYRRRNFWEKTLKNSCLPLAITLKVEGDEFILLKKVTSSSRSSVHFTPDRFFDLSPNSPGGNLTFSSTRFVNELMKPDPQTKKVACSGKDYLKLASLGDFSVNDGGSLKSIQYAMVLPCAESVADIQPLTSPLVTPFSKETCRDKNPYAGLKRLESFFRCMPVAGGLANSIAEPVEFIRYRLVKANTNPKDVSLKLLREKGTIKEGTQKFEPSSSVGLIDDFGSLVFYRNLTSQSLIKFKISKNK